MAILGPRVGCIVNQSYPVISISYGLLQWYSVVHALMLSNHDILSRPCLCPGIVTWMSHPSPFSVWPHLFSGAGNEKRRGEQLKWSLAYRLYIGSFPCAQLHSYQDQFIQPGWAECVFCVFSLGLCFVCPFMFFGFVCVSQFFYVSLPNWVISLTVFGVSVTNLNEPPRALAASTIAWVRS